MVQNNLYAGLLWYKLTIVILIKPVFHKRLGLPLIVLMLLLSGIGGRANLIY